MATNYNLPKPTAGTPRAGEEVSLMVDVSDTVADIDTRINTKAPIESPALTGTPTVPTAPAGTNTTQAASTAFVGTAVDNATSGALDVAFTSGDYIPPTGGTKSTLARGPGTVYALPIFVPVGLTAGVAVEVTVAAGTAGDMARLALAVDGDDGRPGSLLAEASVAIDSTGVKTAALAAVIPAGGRVWALYKSENAGSNPTLTHYSAPTAGWVVPQTLFSAGRGGFQAANASGAFPADLSTLAWGVAGTVPYLELVIA